MRLFSVGRARHFRRRFLRGRIDLYIGLVYDFFTLGFFYEMYPCYASARDEFRVVIRVGLVFYRLSIILSFPRG
jgi:hypothetical protein